MGKMPFSNQNDQTGGLFLFLSKKRTSLRVRVGQLYVVSNKDPGEKFLKLWTSLATQVPAFRNEMAVGRCP
jgi:hypothetical protein